MKAVIGADVVADCAGNGPAFKTALEIPDYRREAAFTMERGVRDG